VARNGPAREGHARTGHPTVEPPKLPGAQVAALTMPVMIDAHQPTATKITTMSSRINRPPWR
jgi:hypothetical protein